MADKSYVGDVGTILVVDTGSDITLATTTKILVRKPDGTETFWTGTLYNTRYIKYTILANDFDMSGTYYLQSYVVLPTWTGRGETATITVYDYYG